MPVELCSGNWPEPGCVFRDWDMDGQQDLSLPEMVVIPAGTFMMGSPPAEPGRFRDEGPQHRVTIAQPFALGRYAVTQAEWQAVMGDHQSHFVGARNPVDSVSWDDTLRFIDALNGKIGLSGENGYRLPSEAEWEYACRAGSTTPFWWGSVISPDRANYDATATYNGSVTGEYRQRTVPVDQFDPNPFGLYQVHGNVREWVQDCWNGTYDGAPPDGTAWTTGDCRRRVLRGGSWAFGPRNLRSALRDHCASAGLRSYTFGFRLARTLSPAP